MTKADSYRARLRSLSDWDAFLLRESGLPGPRGNLELAQVVADEGTPELFRRYLTYTADKAPVNSPYEFLAFCGVVGLGRLLAEGDRKVLPTLRRCAGDPRWRMREAVAMALQRLGDADMDALLDEVRPWAEGDAFEQRAAAAAVCEPRLLRRAKHAGAALRLLDRITASVERAKERRTESFAALRKGLGYCWSVAVVALPGRGKSLMEKWMVRPDPDVRWVMRENLKKHRLAALDAAWCKRWTARLSARASEASPTARRT
jgi:hypothetical protein